MTDKRAIYRTIFFITGGGTIIEYYYEKNDKHKAKTFYVFYTNNWEIFSIKTESFGEALQLAQKNLGTKINFCAIKYMGALQINEKTKI